VERQVRYENRINGICSAGSEHPESPKWPISSRVFRLRREHFVRRVQNLRLRAFSILMPGVATLVPAWTAGVECCLSDDSRPATFIVHCVLSRSD